MQSCGGEFGRLGCAGQCQTGRDPREILKREVCLFETAQCRFQHRGEGVLQAKPDVGGTGLGFGEFHPGCIAQSGTAAGAAAVNSQKKLVFRYDHRDSAPELAYPHNSRERVLIERVGIERPEHRMSTERPSPRYSDIDSWEPADALEAMIDGQFAA